jgi:para-nitrobenzyl esterase
MTLLQLGIMIALAAIPSQVPSAQGAATLQGTRWQLVKFQGGDDRTLTPDDPAKYTIEFAGGGRLTARIDCNRGGGTWKATGSSQLEFGPLALTRAKCPEVDSAVSAVSALKSAPRSSPARRRRPLPDIEQVK